MQWHKNMKKIIASTLLILSLSIPSQVFGVIAVGWNATSTDKGNIQPNAVNGNIPFIIIPGFISTASSTIAASLFNIMGLSNGCLQAASNLITSTGSACGSGSSAPAFTVTSYGASTTTIIGFLNGLFTGNASTTFGGPVYQPALSQGFLYIGSNGRENTVASSSAGFALDTRTLTIAGTANQITSSAGAQNLTADRTWTLSFPNQVIFPQYASSTLGFSTVYASSTNAFFGILSISTTTAGCASITNQGRIFSTGVACGSSSATPGSPTNSIQYNNAGSFGGSATLTFNGSNTMTLGSEGTIFNIISPNGTTPNTEGGTISIHSGDGDGTEAGGELTIEAGTAGSTGEGGRVLIQAGSGGATSGDGGEIEFRGGDAQGGNGDGGSVQITAGTADGVGAQGRIAIRSGGNDNAVLITPSGGEFEFTFPDQSGILCLTTTCSGGSSSYDWKQENSVFGVNALTPTTTIPIVIKSTATSTFVGGIESWTTVASKNFIATSTVGNSLFAGFIGVGPSSAGNASRIYINSSNGGGAALTLDSQDTGGSPGRNIMTIDGASYSSNPGTHTLLTTTNLVTSNRFSIMDNGRVRISTSTTGVPATRVAISSGDGDSFSLVIGSSTATNLTVASTGFGTTTVSGLTVSGSATSTSNVGWNITTGCYAIGGVCLSTSGSSGITSYDAWTHPAAGQSATTSLMLFNGQASSTQESATQAYFGGTATTTFFGNGQVGVSSSTPWGFFSINPISGIGNPKFVIGSSTATSFLVASNGNVGIGTTSPGTLFSIQSVANFQLGTSTFLSPTGGINITGGCFAINNTCIGSSGSGSGTVGQGEPGQFGFYSSSGTSLAGSFNGYASSTNQVSILGVGAGGQNSTTSGTAIKLTAIGYQALGSNTTASDNTAVGWRAMKGTTVTGSANTAIGSEALELVSTGFSNEAFGWTALMSLTTGFQNVALGNQSLSALTRGFNNLGIGSLSGPNIGIGSYNITIGVNAATTLSSGGSNVFIGQGSAFTVSTASSSIAIGNQVDLPSNVDNGQLNIGNVLYGLGLYDNCCSPSSASRPNGRIAVGTTTPYYPLTLASTTGPQFSLTAGSGLPQWTFRNAGGDFFISTTTVAGNATTTKAALAITNGGAISISTSTAGCLNVNTLGLIYSATCPSASGITAYDAFTHSTVFLQNSATTSKIGIGTTTPYYDLTVASSTGPQIALSTGTSGDLSWVFRNSGGNFYLATTTISGIATSSRAALSIEGATTTLNAKIVKVNARILAVGPCGNNVNIPTGGYQPSYLELDGCDANQDTSIILATAGLPKWEIGSAGDTHFTIKSAAGTTEANSAFTTRFDINHDTGQVGFGTGVPTGFVEYASSSGSSLNAVQITYNNTNPSGGTNGVRFSFTNTETNNWFVGTDAGQNRGDNFYISDGTFGNPLFMTGTQVGIFSGASPNSGSELSITGDTYTSGTMSVASTVPWGIMSVAAPGITNYSIPVFTVSTSTLSTGQLISAFGTSTTLVVQSILGRSSEMGVRIGIGTTNYLNTGGLMDQLVVKGRINNEDWLDAFCTAPVGGVTEQTEGPSGCSDYSFYEDNTGAIGVEVVPSSYGTTFGSISASTALANNDGAGIFVNGPVAGWLTLSTSTPVMEVNYRLVNSNSSTTQFYIGFTNLNTTGSTFEVEPTQGCYFTASSTTANWRAICRTNSGSANMTMVDTGVASSTKIGATGSFRKFRIEADSTKARFYIQNSESAVLSLVAQISTTYPSTQNLNAGLHYGLISNLTSGFSFYRLRTWWRDNLATQ